MAHTCAHFQMHWWCPHNLVQARKQRVKPLGSASNYEHITQGQDLRLSNFFSNLQLETHARAWHSLKAHEK